jgi:hypothetical protein
MMVYTAERGSPSAERLKLIAKSAAMPWQLSSRIELAGERPDRRASAPTDHRRPFDRF